LLELLRADVHPHGLGREASLPGREPDEEFEGARVAVRRWGTIAAIGFRTTTPAAPQAVTGSFGKRAVRGSRTTPLVVLA